MKNLTDEQLAAFHKQLHPKPYFHFNEVQPFRNFTFEKLNSGNFEQLFNMFGNDDSPFIDKRFTSLKNARQYAEYLELYGTFSPKHGCCDWYFKMNEEYAGVLHLYDLSLETWNENDKRCWIGFATKPALRNQGITTGIVQYFVEQIFESYSKIKYIHSMTLLPNAAANAVLANAEFYLDKAEKMNDGYVFFVKEKVQ